MKEFIISDDLYQKNTQKYEWSTNNYIEIKQGNVVKHISVPAKSETKYIYTTSEISIFSEGIVPSKVYTLSHIKNPEDININNIAPCTVSYINSRFLILDPWRIELRAISEFNSESKCSEDIHEEIMRKLVSYPELPDLTIFDKLTVCIDLIGKKKEESGDRNIIIPFVQSVEGNPIYSQICTSLAKSANNTLTLRRRLNPAEYEELLKRIHVSNKDKTVVIKGLKSFTTVNIKDKTKEFFNYDNVLTSTILDVSVYVDTISKVKIVSTTDDASTVILFRNSVSLTTGGWIYTVYSEKGIDPSDTEGFKAYTDILNKDKPGLVDQYVTAVWTGSNGAAVWTGSNGAAVWTGSNGAAVWTGSNGAAVWTGSNVTAVWTGDRKDAVNNIIPHSEISSTGVIPSMSNIEEANLFMQLITKYQNALVILGNLLKRPSNTLKRMTIQAMGLDKETYSMIYPPIGYLVGEKADGRHSLFVAYKGRAFIIDNNVIEFDINTLTSYVIEGELTYEAKSGEQEGGAGAPILTHENKDNFYFNAFDVLYCDSMNLTEEITEKRIAYLPEVVDIISMVINCRHKTVTKITALPPLSSPPASMSTTNITTAVTEMKTVESAIVREETMIAAALDKKWNKKYPYKIDGLMLTTSDTTYWNTKVWKWKVHNSIDFLVKECPKPVLGKSPYITKAGYTLYWLFNGIRRDTFIKLSKRLPMGYNSLFPNKDHLYFPINFAPSDMPLAYLYWSKDAALDGKVVELVYNNSTDQWDLITVRIDRDHDLQTGGYFGNDFNTAEVTWLMIRNPLTYENLSKLDDTSYFQEYKSDIYRAEAGYNSFIKATLINKFCYKTKWVIDLCSGKGQDMGRYIDALTNHVTYVEENANALMTLVKKRLNYKFNTYHNKHKKNSQNFRSASNSQNFRSASNSQRDKSVNDMTTIKADVNDVAALQEKIEKLREAVPYLQNLSPDTIVCNFAIHYLIDSIRPLAKLIYDLLPKGGKFIFTCLDGFNIVKILTENNIGINESWIQEEAFKDSTGEMAIKYQIERRYQSNTLTASGQKIAVKLPFSAGKLYEESLVNVDYIIKVFSSLGMAVIYRGGFDAESFCDTFNVHRPFIYKDLTTADKTWIGLYTYVILSK